VVVDCSRTEFLRGCLIEFVCTIVALWFGLLASHVAKVVKSAVTAIGHKPQPRTVNNTFWQPVH